MSTPKGKAARSALTRPEIHKVVRDYIGVTTDGYLQGFSYRTHEEFYPYYCDLDIDVQSYRPASTREAFIRILEDVTPDEQAKILRGVLEKCPPDSSDERQKLAPRIEAMIARLAGAPAVATPQTKITTGTVERAARDAETLIQNSGATSGVDRVHTALHGYLLAVCDQEGITYEKDPDITALFKLLLKSHPKLQDLGPRPQDMAKVVRSLSAVIDALNPVRNRASVAHPNAKLLDQAEAMLFVNAARTLVHYLDARLSS